MGKRKKTVFAEDEDGNRYVMLSAVMHPLWAFADGLSLTLFGKGKKRTAYMRIENAIDWCRCEMTYHSADKYTKMIDVLERALQDPSRPDGEKS